MRRSFSFSLFALAATTTSLLLTSSSPASALSTTVCDSTGMTWVSESPRLEGAFPHYQQLFFCSGNVNIEGRPVDACVDGGKACDGAAAAAGFCRYLGFDGAIYDQVVVSKVSEGNIGTPARSLTGEWCTGFGIADLGDLHREAFDNLVEKYKASSPAPPPQPCSVLERVACYRTRDTLRSSWKAAGDRTRAVVVEQQLPEPSFAPSVGGGGGGGGGATAAAASSPAPAPRANVAVSSAAATSPSVEENKSSAAAASAPSSVSGRRLTSS